MSTYLEYRDREVERRQRQTPLASMSQVKAYIFLAGYRWRLGDRSSTCPLTFGGSIRKKMRRKTMSYTTLSSTAPGGHRLEKPYDLLS